jgi:hypothetical protein
MTRHLPISLICLTLSCFTLICAADADAQILQPGAEPQPLPGTPMPEFTAPRSFPRMRRQVPPRTRPGQPVPNSPGPGVPATTGPAANGPQQTGPRQPTLSPFAVPSGLSAPINDLLSDLGYQSGKTFPLTPSTSYDLAYECYANGYYADAILFASHGLRMCNDARLHLIKGVCELRRGQTSVAEQTAGEFRNSLGAQQVYGMEAARERINDPWAVRFVDIVQYQSTGH